MSALNAIVAAGVVIAGLVLCQTPAIRRARWVVAGLTAYGAAAFLHAMLTGIALGSALAGHGLFQRLPYVLQGAFIGGFVVLPLGWLASIARAGIPRFRKGSLRHNAYPAVALTTCVAVLFTSVDHPSRPSSPEVVGADPQTRLAALERSLRAIEDGERESPRDRWDPRYVIDTVGRDPQRLFAWVRANTCWIPYHGVLRGPVGVLIDREGNSLDRALLLATLLEKTGELVRLAHGELTAEQARQRLPALVTARSAVRFDRITAEPHLQTQANPNIQSSAERYRPIADAMGGTFNAKTEAVNSVASELDVRVTEETDRLLAAVQRPDPAEDWKRRFDAAIAALRDHWWVQRQDGQKWVDLDLLDETGNAGSALVPAKETTAINGLAAGLHHEITVRVVTEQWSNGRLKDGRVLEYVLRPAELFEKPVVLQFWPGSWPSETQTDPNGRYGLRATALEQDRWVAVLQIGSTAVAQGVISDKGDINDPAAANPLAGLGAGIANAFSPKGREQSTRAGVLTAAWIEYEIRAPGGPPRTVRRVVFDLLGPTVRAAGPGPLLTFHDEQRLTRSLALTMRTEILPVACRIAPEFAAHLAAHSLVANRDVLRAIAALDFAPRSEKTKQQLAETVPPVSPLLWLALARLEWSGSANSIVLDRPSVFTRHRSLVAKGKDFAARDAIDIVWNEVGVDLTKRDGFAIRLEQGVLDTNAEALVHVSAATRNVGQAFATSRDWSTVTSGQRSAVDGLALSTDFRRSIVQDLDRGYMVVAPRSPVKGVTEKFVGWWRIDPETGDTLGVDGNGWGSSTEDSALFRMAVEASKGFVFEYSLCQAIPQTLNLLRLIDYDYFGGWHPSWTAPAAKGKDPSALWNENNSVCLIQAIAMGFVATLPLLLMTLRYSRPMRVLQLTRAEEIVGRALDEAAVGQNRVRIYQVTLHKNGSVTVSFSGADTSVASAAQRVRLPDNFTISESARPGFRGGNAMNPDGTPYMGDSSTCCEPRMAQGIRNNPSPVLIEGDPIWRGTPTENLPTDRPKPNAYPSTNPWVNGDPTKMDPCPSCAKNKGKM